jgi:hypothetical protein
MHLPESRNVRIDAIEAFEAYVGPLHRYVYDEVFIEDVVTFVGRKLAYDIIFMGDVLEHIEKKNAMEKLLPSLVAGASMGVVVSVPATVREQDAVFGNTYEVHRSQWSAKDFWAVAPLCYVGLKGAHRIAFLTRDRTSFKVVKGRSIRRRVRAVVHALQDAW